MVRRLQRLQEVRARLDAANERRAILESVIAEALADHEASADAMSATGIATGSPMADLDDGDDNGSESDNNDSDYRPHILVPRRPWTIMMRTEHRFEGPERHLPRDVDLAMYGLWRSVATIRSNARAALLGSPRAQRRFYEAVVAAIRCFWTLEDFAEAMRLPENQVYGWVMYMVSLASCDNMRSVLPAELAWRA